MKVDVRNEGEKFVLEADMPGMHKDDLKIEVDEGVLTISAVYNEDREQKDEEDKYVYRERRIGNMSRSFNLEGIREDDITASFKDGVLTANYRHGSLNQVRYSFHADGGVLIDIDYTFNGVVDLLGVAFDYPEQNVKSKRWVGKGPYRVWQNRMEGPQFGYWQNDYNDPIPGETWEYPEFKGYFAGVDWMQIETSEGKIGISPLTSHLSPLYVGVYTPRDGRDHILYTLPETGIAILKAIPAVRNKVNTTDLNGPSAQPYWSQGKGNINTIIRFD